jgi:PAS domain-containing protein
VQFDNSQQVNELASLPPEKPKPPERSVWAAAGRGVVGAAAQLAGQVQQLSAGIDERYAAEQDQTRGAGSRQAASARQSAGGLQARGDQLTDYERGLRPDAATATTAENVVYGLTKGLTKAIGSVVTLGPVAGAAVFGGSEAGATYDDLTREGVDSGTALKAAGVAGVANAAGVALPMMGSTLARTAALYVAGGPGGFMAQQQATRSILEAADYAEQAQKFDPFDPLGLVLSSLIPLPFAGYGAMRNLRAGKKGAPVAPDQAMRGDQAPVNTEVAPRAADAPAARAAEPMAARVADEPVARAVEPEPVRPAVSQEHIDAALTHNLTVARQAADSVPPAAGVAEMFRGPVTENPNFKAWFGESKVTREDGSPMVVYRGRVGGDDSLRGAVAYFTPDARAAKDYAETRVSEGFDGRPEVLSAYVRLVNPADEIDIRRVAIRAGLDLMHEDYPAAYLDGSPDLVAALKAEGYDGAIGLDGAPSTGTEIKSIAVFDKTAVKSAIGNSGRFDPDSGSLTDPIPPALKVDAAPVAPKTDAPAGQAMAELAATDAAPVSPAKAQAAAESSANNRLQELTEQNPDMVVRINEDGKPVTVAEELAALKREVAEGTDTELGALDADLVRVAAECALATATA